MICKLDKQTLGKRKRAEEDVWVGCGLSQALRHVLSCCCRAVPPGSGSSRREVITLGQLLKLDDAGPYLADKRNARFN